MTGIMTMICTSLYPSPYSIEKASPYSIEKVGDSPYLYSYPVNVEIFRQNGMGSSNTHINEFICHL